MSNEVKKNEIKKEDEIKQEKTKADRISPFCLLLCLCVILISFLSGFLLCRIVTDNVWKYTRNVSELIFEDYYEERFMDELRLPMIRAEAEAHNYKLERKREADAEYDRIIKQAKEDAEKAYADMMLKQNR